jgi:hypothetical protein
MAAIKTNILKNLSAMKIAPQVKTRGGFDYIINAMLLFSIIGMCIKIFFGNVTSPDGSYGRASATVWGYGIVAFSILTIMFVSYALHDKIARIENKSVFSILGFIKSFLSSAGPSMLTVIILLWIVALNTFYYERINKGQVASEYYQLSAGTSFLFIFQIICVFQYLKIFIAIKTKTSDDPEAEVSLSRISFAVYFITAINMIVSMMMTIMLQFFSTDG